MSDNKSTGEFKGDASAEGEKEKREEGETVSALSANWLERREKVVQRAIEDEDMSKLKEVAALPGGYGSNEMRKRVWPLLLRTKRYYGTGRRNENEEAKTSEAHEAQSRASEEDETQQEKELSFDQVPKERERESGNALGSDGDAANGNGTDTDFHHPDEGQVLLDAKRSFVSYPKGLPPGSKQAMQDDLQDLIVGVLRKFPGLHYFQGYHDILSVLYLTYIPVPTPAPRSRSASRSGRRRERSEQSARGELTAMEEKQTGSITEEQHGVPAISGAGPNTTDAARGTESESGPPLSNPDNSQKIRTTRDTPEWQTLRQCAEVVSLCRVRDAMGTGMEGMMGLLRILKRLLKVADPELASFSSSISPVPTLPFFALSWILCLFSHDVDTLEPVQRMFDYLLSRNPISAVYLAVAILIAKKPQMLELATKLGPEPLDDPSLLHPLFARLPPLHPDTPGEPLPPSPSRRPEVSADLVREEDENPYRPISLSHIFSLSDELLQRYPWDGDEICGNKVMGEGSVVCSYELESEDDWNLQQALSYVDKEVVVPGAGLIDDDEPEDEMKPHPIPIRRRRFARLRLPRDRLGTAVACSVVLVGVGIAVFGLKAGGARSDWARWWALVIRSWSSKGGDVANRLSWLICGWRDVGGLLLRSLENVL